MSVSITTSLWQANCYQYKHSRAVKSLDKVAILCSLFLVSKWWLFFKQANQPNFWRRSTSDFNFTASKTYVCIMYHKLCLTTRGPKKSRQYQHSFFRAQQIKIEISLALTLWETPCHDVDMKPKRISIGSKYWTLQLHNSVSNTQNQ